MYSDSKYEFHVLHVFAAIWKEKECELLEILP